MPTVSLYMIANDEASVIERCLASVRRSVDHWVIVDTGSTDGTQGVIRRFLSGVPGELHERPWKNFGHNRTEAIELARGKADYVLGMDAEHFSCSPPGWKWPDLTAGAYRLTLVSGQSPYDQTPLMFDRPEWRWMGMLHEYLAADAPVVDEEPVSEPNSDRHVVYLGQSWRDAGELATLRDAYRRRAQTGGWEEEVWYCVFQLATLTNRLGAPHAETIDACLKACQYRQTRAGSLVFPVHLFELRRQWALSRLFAREAVETPVPKDTLCLDRAACQWHIRR